MALQVSWKATAIGIAWDLIAPGDGEIALVELDGDMTGDELVMTGGGAVSWLVARGDTALTTSRFCGVEGRRRMLCLRGAGTGGVSPIFGLSVAELKSALTLLGLF